MIINLKLHFCIVKPWLFFVRDVYIYNYYIAFSFKLLFVALVSVFIQIVIDLQTQNMITTLAL